MGWFSDGRPEEEKKAQIEAGKTRLAKAEKEMRGRKDTGDRVADRKIRERMEQDLSVAKANVRDMSKWR